MHVYLDNAATTPMDVQVIDKMTEVMHDCYGNASAIHGQGRKAKAEVEMARKEIAKVLNCNGPEIVFTGSGTEADNMALRCAVNDLDVTHIITSKIEHKAVLETAQELEAKKAITISYVKLDQMGRADLADLERLAEEKPRSLISLMHANNEIGTLNDIKAISKIARAHGCYFHTDTVQTIGHYPIDLKVTDVDFLACSAHKFHGPKGVGFLYKSKSLRIRPIMTGGGQEGSLRAGTENVTGIVGLAKALEVASRNIEVKINAVQRNKTYFKEQLEKEINGIRFNGDTSEQGSLYTILNVSLPPNDNASTLLFQLDMNGIYVSGGSACNSGAIGSSHVLEGIGHPTNRSAVRFSFSKFTTRKELDYAVGKLKELYP
ncbi:MAG: cysteine desulfurase family protein [Bacteroidia bacterium]|jgi:cysteine desulfurase|nr:cysteine desulfurase family protein [Bacteroidia bacterium]